jgi:hypothetical protein
MRVAAVNENDRVQYLVAVIGPEGYKALKDLAYPELPTAITYEAATRLLRRHFEPRRIVVAERATFHSRVQRPGESVKSYFLALKDLASTCEFHTVQDVLSETIRDKFVAGLRSASIRERLCEQTLNMQATYEKAITLEATRASSQGAMGDSESRSVHAARSVVVSVPNSGRTNSSQRGAKRGHNNKWQGRLGPPAARSQPSQAGPGSACRGCGGDHARRNCPHKDKKCSACQKMVHLARVCEGNKQQARPQGVGHTSVVSESPAPARTVGSPSNPEARQEADSEITTRGCPTHHLTMTGICTP